MAITWMLVNEKPSCIQFIFTSAQRDVNTDKADQLQNTPQHLTTIASLILIQCNYNIIQYNFISLR